MQKSFKHHYVPQWYQRGFMFENQNDYFCLDLKPKIPKKKDGTHAKVKTIQKKGPKKFFVETGLYTTKYYNEENDDIERFLFGQIDSMGAEALPAMIDEDWMSKMDTNFSRFFEYMDAQILRTPRGLEWIVKAIQSQSNNELLLHMQAIRRMHCTMWIEAKMEIVSSVASDVKFIVSDNPITTYNPVYTPEILKGIYPYTPAIKLLGTRTIFPIDMNHCVILTNLEYAMTPDQNNAQKQRQNARYHDDTIANFLDIIRERELSQESVLKINYIIKKSADKYIAAAKEKWLYPEELLNNFKWKELDEVLISSKFKHIGIP